MKLQKMKKWWNKLNSRYNPYYYWTFFKKYVKRPKMSFSINSKYRYTFGLPMENNKWHIKLKGLGWKVKFDEVRWEYNPYFSFYIPGILHFLITWGYEKEAAKNSYLINLICWENMLTLYYANKISKKDIVDIFLENLWRDINKNRYNAFCCLKKNAKNWIRC